MHQIGPFEIVIIFGFAPLILCEVAGVACGLSLWAFVERYIHDRETLGLLSAPTLALGVNGLVFIAVLLLVVGSATTGMG